ncbi:hypothetical protein EDD18DRAFT_1328654 [Armillaria luteobubalina]|uniref:Uncharacterized protein n=1 Tax=Armillaria luteobubalina TaxID=153913 RepID=A0AA39QF43_9AGAR|nr:hypothetical protein EDD18DRAFT_1328654 [Armillaria luteobubalina]
MLGAPQSIITGRFLGNVISSGISRLLLYILLPHALCLEHSVFAKSTVTVFRLHRMPDWEFLCGTYVPLSRLSFK